MVDQEEPFTEDTEAGSVDLDELTDDLTDELEGLDPADAPVVADRIADALTTRLGGETDR